MEDCGYKVWVAGAAGLDFGFDFEGPWNDFLAALITPWKAGVGTASPSSLWPPGTGIASFGYGATRGWVVGVALFLGALDLLALGVL